MAPERATFHRLHDGIATNLEIAVSTEDDVEVRRLAIMNRSDRTREIDVTSYAEIVLATPASDLAHPAFGKLFVETAFRSDCAALLCRRRPGGVDADEVWAVHVLSLEGRPQGALEYETDRSRFLGRGRGPDNPQALDGRSLSNTVGATLDPIVSLRQRVRLAPGGFVQAVVRDRHRVERGHGGRAGPEILRAERVGPNLRAGRDARAQHAQPPGHHDRRCARLRAAGVTGALRRRLASRGCATLQARNTLGREALWAHEHLRRPPDPGRPGR